jgi:hypothetical protein
MITRTTLNDPLVDAISTRLRRLDLLGWQRISAWAEESELSFEDLRLLLALALKIDDGPAAISELAELAGFPLDVAYPAIHRLRGRGYLREEHRRYLLTEQGKRSSPRWTPRTARASGHTSTSSIQAHVSSWARPSRSRVEAPNL